MPPKPTVRVHAVSPERDALEIRFPRVAGYQTELPDDRITTAIVEAERSGDGNVTALIDSFSPTGTTRDVNFVTSKQLKWRTRADRCHVNWAVCDTEWEREFCQVVEANPDVLAYVKNAGMGFEVPYGTGGQNRIYVPDFVLRVSDDGGEPLHLVVELKGFRGEDAQDKAATMRNYWVPGVNRLGAFGYWQFVEFRNSWVFTEELQTAITQARREGHAFRTGGSALSSREEVLAALRELKPRLQQEFGIASLKLFGSFARDEAQLTSDVDLIVEYHTEPKGWGNFGEGPFLEEVLGRSVDIALRENLRDHVRPNAERDAIDV